MILSQYRPERMRTDCGELRVAVGKSCQLFLRLNVGKIRFLQNLDQSAGIGTRRSTSASAKKFLKKGASRLPALWQVELAIQVSLSG